MRTAFFSGADDEARTRYLHLGKVALYRMSYIRMLCGFVNVYIIHTDRTVVKHYFPFFHSRHNAQSIKNDVRYPNVAKKTLKLDRTKAELISFSPSLCRFGSTDIGSRTIFFHFFFNLTFVNIFCTKDIPHSV